MEELDEEAMNPLLGELKIMFQRYFSRLKTELLDQLFWSTRDLRAEVQDIQGKLEAVDKNLSATREMTNNLALGFTAALNIKKALNPVVAAQIQNADLFLRSEAIFSVTISSVSKYLTTAFCRSSSEQVSEGVRMLLFAPGAQLRKKTRRTDLGRRFVDLRTRIIRNMVFNCEVGVQREAMSLLRPHICLQERRESPSGPLESQGTEIAGTPEVSDGEKEGIFRLPAWTVKGFIGKEDIDTAVGEILKQEVEDGKDLEVADAVSDGDLVQTQSTRKRKTINSATKPTIREEISREIVKHMWKRWTDWLGTSRNEARKSSTLDLVVVFLEPNSRWKPMCSCNSVDDYIDQIDNVPMTKTCSLFRTGFEVSSSNLRVFGNLLKDYPNFMLTCQYNVEVFDGVGKMAVNQGGQEVTISRDVNLLQVAANFLITYFQVLSLEVFLGGSQTALRVIFLVALAFSAVVFRASRPRTGASTRENIASEAKELGLFIPGDTGRLNLVVEKCLRMTKENYDELNKLDEKDEVEIGYFALGEEIGSDDEDVENIFL